MDYAEFIRIADTFRGSGRYWAAQINYKKAVEELKPIADREMNHQRKKEHYDQMSVLIDRIQSLDVNFDYGKYKEDGNVVEIIVVPEHAKTFDYADIFAKFCTVDVKEIVVYESDMFLKSHVRNVRTLLRKFREICPNLKLVMLKCQKVYYQGIESQAIMMQQFQKELEVQNITLEFDMTLHKHFNQTKIVLSNGYVFLFDRGLDTFTYTKPSDTVFLPPVQPNRIEVWYTHVFNNDAMATRD